MRLLDSARVSLGKIAIFWLLWTECRRRKVNVSWSTMPLHRRHFGISKNKGLLVGVYDGDRRVITLSPASWFDPWTLAHELGHHVLWQKKGARHTEAQANTAAREIVCAIVPRIESTLLANEFNRELPS